MSYTEVTIDLFVAAVFSTAVGYFLGTEAGLGFFAGWCVMTAFAGRQ